jgi:hypothetical protein
MGTTTVVKMEYGNVLLEAVRRRKALAQARGDSVRAGSICKAGT